MKAATVVNINPSVRWIGRDGMPVTSEDTVQTLNTNLEEVRKMCQQVLEDAVMMGCSEHFVRVVLSDTIASLERPYASRNTNS